MAELLLKLVLGFASNRPYSADNRDYSGTDSYADQRRSLHGMESGEIRPGRNGTVFTRQAIRRRVIARVDVLGIDHTRAGKRHLVSGLDLGRAYPR